MRTQNIFIIEPNSSEQADALKAFIKALKMKFVISESNVLEIEKPFTLSEDQKQILDSQDNILPEDCVDAFNSLEELKKEYGL